MIIMSLAPTSLSDIRPSGETLDRVSPGMSRVVARIFGVADPETLALPRANLNETTSETLSLSTGMVRSTHI